MPKPIEILKQGQFTDMLGQTVKFSEDELAQIAKGYSPEKFEAPLVVGHPQHDLPAYGWVKSVNLSDNILKAIPQQVEVQFSEMVNAGRFKKVSAAFFGPSHPSNPTPGNYYLKHVGFLGAAAPAVQGLKTVAFAEEERKNILTVEFALEGAEIEPRKIEISASNSEKENIDLKTTQEALDLRQTKLDEQEAKLKKQASDLKEKEQGIVSTQLSAFVDDLAKEGKVVPGMKKDIVSFMESIHGQNVVQFSDEKKSTPLDFFKDFLSKQPKIVEFGEFASDKESATGGSPKDVAQKATELKNGLEAKGTIISFAEAVERVSGGDNGTN